MLESLIVGTSQSCTLISYCITYKFKFSHAILNYFGTCKIRKIEKDQIYNNKPQSNEDGED